MRLTLAVLALWPASMGIGLAVRAGVGKGPKKWALCQLSGAGWEMQA